MTYTENTIPAFRPIPTLKYFIDLSGRTYGLWTVLGYLGPRNGTTYWLARCSCGVIRPVAAGPLSSGRTLSCGCRKAALQRLRITHGATRMGQHTTEYRIYAGAKIRCTNPSHPAFHNYGGRGIKFLFESFAHFLATMGLRPPGSTLDRINNDGPYAPDNCRWATRTEQANNTRNNRLILVQGVMLTVAEQCRRFDVPYKRTHYRIQHGWCPECAFMSPVGGDCSHRS